MINRLIKVAADLPAEAIEWNLRPPCLSPSDDDPLTAAIIDAESYRLLAHQAIAALQTTQAQYERLRRQLFPGCEDNERLAS